MDVLQVTTTSIYPPSHGGSHRSHGLVCSFPGQGDTVHRVCQGGVITNHSFPHIETRIEIEPGYVEHRPVNPFHDLASVPQALFDFPNVFLGKQLRIWPPKQLQNRLASADIVLVEGPLQVPALTALAGDTPVVYSSHNVEADRFKYLTEQTLGDIVYQRLVRLEELAVTRASAVICTSEADRNRYEELYDISTEYIIIRNGIYRDAVTEPNANTAADEGIDLHARYDIDSENDIGIFVGSNYGPNVDAARYLVGTGDAFSECGVHVVLVGDVCTQLNRTHENVTALGFVDDLTGHLRGADIGLNPVVRGGGSNIKLLEYVAAGLPVLSTPFGVEGFDIENGTHAVVCDRTAFPDAIQQLCDPDVRTSISEHAHEYVTANHIWEDLSKDLREQLSTVV